MKVSLETDSFVRVQNPDSTIVKYLTYSVKKTHRYYAESCWFVHIDFLLPVVQLGYGSHGYVDYSDLPIGMQMQIAQEKVHWGEQKSTQEVVTHQISLEQAYATMYLVPGAPHFLVSAVWKALAKKFHPDMGGNEELFKRYSGAHDRIMGS
jgi:hypothetical protein